MLSRSSSIFCMITDSILFDTIKFLSYLGGLESYIDLFLPFRDFSDLKKLQNLIRAKKNIIRSLILYNKIITGLKVFELYQSILENIVLSCF